MFKQQISALSVKQSTTAFISMLVDENASFERTKSEAANITLPHNLSLSRW